MMTPGQYFDEHPDVAVLEFTKKGDDYQLVNTPTAGLILQINAERINWTGYSRRIAYNPHFQWGKRREIEWTGETTKHPRKVPLELALKDRPLRQLCNAEGEPLNIWEIGRYVDAPDEKPAPQLSRFLPEGCVWEIYANGRRIQFNYMYAPLWDDLAICPIENWHYHGLLHPSEGGGFQRMKSLTELRDNRDILWDNDTITSGNVCGGIPKGWRPHFKGGES